MTRNRKYLGIASAAFLAALVAGGAAAEAAGVLTIGRREDGTTFDPIKTSQNVDFWVFSNVFDVLVRVDKAGTKLVPGLAESWTVSDDGAGLHPQDARREILRRQPGHRGGRRLLAAADPRQPGVADGATPTR